MSRLPGTCPHRPPCPGCPRYGDERLDPLALAELEAFCADVNGPLPRVEIGPAAGYRHRARLAVRGRVTSPKVGIFHEGTHRVVDVPRCPVHHPLVNDVAAALRQSLVATRTPTYSDEAHAGLVRYLQVVVERSSGRAQVVVVANAERVDAVSPLFDALGEVLGERAHSLHFNGNPHRTNAILGPIWQRLRGPEAVEERIGGTPVFFPPGAFGQSNLQLADRAVAAIHAAVEPGARVVEFHAGVGAIGLGLVGRSRAVVFNELGEESLKGLRAGLARLDRARAERVEVLEGPAGDAAHALRPGDTVIVDPPRKGLDRELVERLTEVRAGKILYLSCGLQSFLREAAVLVRQGGYRLVDCVAFGFLPFTSHVETLARFE